MTTGAFERWFQGLDPRRTSHVRAALERVAIAGPVLGRPEVDAIKSSRIHNLKELRLHRSVRILFAFDPNRRAVMLVGGDKAGSWNRWYRQHIPVAERLYSEHLRSIGKEDRCLSRPSAGLKSAPRSR